MPRAPPLEMELVPGLPEQIGVCNPCRAGEKIALGWISRCFITQQGCRQEEEG